MMQHIKNNLLSPHYIDYIELVMCENMFNDKRLLHLTS